ncbi:MAG: hypothetical protein RMX97_30745 [Nostoc sp. DedQUE11]|nr:hypothetical protein [Nostoc sp. DedQUE11]
MRAAIIAANTNGDTSDTINLAAGNYTLSLAGANEDAAATGDLDITNGSITIVGAGVGSTSITANQIDRVFQVLTGATLTLSELTIRPLAKVPNTPPPTPPLSKGRGEKA